MEKWASSLWTLRALPVTRNCCIWLINLPDVEISSHEAKNSCARVLIGQNVINIILGMLLSIKKFLAGAIRSLYMFLKDTLLAEKRFQPVRTVSSLLEICIWHVSNQKWFFLCRWLVDCRRTIVNYQNSIITGWLYEKEDRSKDQ